MSSFLEQNAREIALGLFVVGLVTQSYRLYDHFKDHINMLALSSPDAFLQPMDRRHILTDKQKRILQQVKFLFETCDKNRNGRLEGKEVCTMLTLMGLPSKLLSSPEQEFTRESLIEFLQRNHDKIGQAADSTIPLHTVLKENVDFIPDLLVSMENGYVNEMLLKCQYRLPEILGYMYQEHKTFVEAVQYYTPNNEQAEKQPGDEKALVSSSDASIPQPYSPLSLEFGCTNKPELLGRDKGKLEERVLSRHFGFDSKFVVRVEWKTVSASPSQNPLYQMSPMPNPVSQPVQQSPLPGIGNRNVLTDMPSTGNLNNLSGNADLSTFKIVCTSTPAAGFTVRSQFTADHIAQLEDFRILWNQAFPNCQMMDIKQPSKTNLEIGFKFSTEFTQHIGTALQFLQMILPNLNAFLELEKQPWEWWSKPNISGADTGNFGIRIKGLSDRNIHPMLGSLLTWLQPMLHTLQARVVLKDAKVSFAKEQPNPLIQLFGLSPMRTLAQLYGAHRAKYSPSKAKDYVFDIIFRMECIHPGFMIDFTNLSFQQIFQSLQVYYTQQMQATQSTVTSLSTSTIAP